MNESGEMVPKEKKYTPKSTPKPKKEKPVKLKKGQFIGKYELYTSSFTC